MEKAKVSQYNTIHCQLYAALTLKCKCSIVRRVFGCMFSTIPIYPSRLTFLEPLCLPLLSHALFLCPIIFHSASRSLKWRRWAAPSPHRPSSTETPWTVIRSGSGDWTNWALGSTPLAPGEFPNVSKTFPRRYAVGDRVARGKGVGCRAEVAGCRYSGNTGCIMDRGDALQGARWCTKCIRLSLILCFG